MTPIERICRALCLADGLDPDRKFKSSNWGPDCAPHEYAWHEYQPRARAVLEAIREPSEVMAKAGKDALPAFEAPLQADASDCWQAMIDAALGEA